MRVCVMKVKGFSREFDVYTTREEPYARAAWTVDTEKKGRRLRKWRDSHNWFDGRVETFALSKAYADIDDRTDDAWECVGLLGQGSFGVVGKWCLFDRDGRVVDTLAIKQVQNLKWMNSNNQVRLPGEYAIPYWLYDQGCTAVVKPRKVRYFDVERPKWRFYTDFHPHGTLWDLVDRYIKRNRQENRRSFIPEAFIWQALHDVADVYHHMGAFHGSSLGADRAVGHFILHLDIKDSNILLGSAPWDKKFMPYSKLKLADWGMSVCTSRQDPDNPEEHGKNGTLCWMPPEQRDYGRYGGRWEYPVMGPRLKPYTEAHGLWQLAACIYGMMELDKNNNKLEAMVRDAENKERRLRQHNYSPLFGYDNRNYSQELCRLVEDCLCVRPEKRPRTDELQRRVAKGLQPYLNRFAQNGAYERLLM